MKRTCYLLLSLFSSTKQCTYIHIFFVEKSELNWKSTLTGSILMSNWYALKCTPLEREWDRKKTRDFARKWEVNLFDRLEQFLFWTIVKKKKEVHQFLEVSWNGWLCLQPLYTSQLLVLSNHTLKKRKKTEWTPITVETVGNFLFIFSFFLQFHAVNCSLKKTNISRNINQKHCLFVIHSYLFSHYQYIQFIVCIHWMHQLFPFNQIWFCSHQTNSNWNKWSLIKQQMSTVNHIITKFHWWHHSILFIFLLSFYSVRV